MPDANGVWTANEADAAFNEFASVFAWLTATQRRFGNGSERNQEAALILHHYIAGLSDERLALLAAFAEEGPEICQALQMIIGLDQLRRALVTRTAP